MNKKVVVFYDEKMHLTEDTDYLKRIETHPHEYGLDGFRDKQSAFGTLSMLTNIIEKKPDHFNIIVRK